VHILGIHNGGHDAAACLFRDYDLLAAVSLERLTRRKNDGVTALAEVPLPAIDECLAIAGLSRADVDVVCASRAHWNVQSYRLAGRWGLKQRSYRWLGIERTRLMTDMMRKQGTEDASKIFDTQRFRRRYGFDRAAVFFYNHHAAHGVPAYFYSEFEDALIYTADGVGDNVSYSARRATGGAIDLVFGGDENLGVPYAVNSLGLLYCYFTDALGFIWNRHEGKVTGLAAFGAPLAAEEIVRHFAVDDGGWIASDFPSYEAMRDFALTLCRRLTREDAAASVQAAVETLVCRAAEMLMRRTGRRFLALGGGLFANVRLNRALLETTSAERIFVYPAMGDEGLPVGGCLAYLHERDGAGTWQRNRRRLESLHLGRDHGGSFAAAARTFPQVAADAERAVEKTVDALVAGRVIAIYTGRMEFGPRALGARSILASPVRREVNDTINRRLERSEFMPFAPVVLADRAAEVFDIHAGNAHAAGFMTITCDVRPQWRERIPAVVHVDGSARPQTITAHHNPLYHQVLDLFHRRTGLPVLVNTSFNVHEEPIVDRPEQALKSLVDGRIDGILTEEALYTAAGAP
jgi:carbamoyltransferase